MEDDLGKEMADPKVPTASELDKVALKLCEMDAAKYVADKQDNKLPKGSDMELTPTKCNEEEEGGEEDNTEHSFIQVSRSLRTKSKGKTGEFVIIAKLCISALASIIGKAMELRQFFMDGVPSDVKAAKIAQMDALLVQLRRADHIVRRLHEERAHIPPSRHATLEEQFLRLQKVVVPAEACLEAVKSKMEYATRKSAKWRNQIKRKANFLVVPLILYYGPRAAYFGRRQAVANREAFLEASKIDASLQIVGDMSTSLEIGLESAVAEHQRNEMAAALRRLEAEAEARRQAEARALAARREAERLRREAAQREAAEAQRRREAEEREAEEAQQREREDAERVAAAARRKAAAAARRAADREAKEREAQVASRARRPREVCVSTPAPTPAPSQPRNDRSSCGLFGWW